MLQFKAGPVNGILTYHLLISSVIKIIKKLTKITKIFILVLQVRSTLKLDNNKQDLHLFCTTFLTCKCCIIITVY